MSYIVRRIVLTSSVLALVGMIGVGPAARTASGAAITVREPAFGLPHISADTDAELARESGRQTARDRFTQLILLARVGRGTLYQAFSALDPTTLNGDLSARQTGYTSSELNNMYAKLPARERAMVLEYCKGVNDVLEQIYTGASPEPIEVNILRSLGFNLDLFGNRTNVSDQVDPFYASPGGDWPTAGFQFTPEMSMAIAVLEVRNFGLGGFEETARFAELQALVATHGAAVGTELWSDLNFVNDPLAPVTVPDPTTPGYGGPLAAVTSPTRLAALAARYPHYDYAAGVQRRKDADAQRAQVAMALGAWPKLGSYSWLISGGKSATGYPWLGGFPQTGIQTPSIMHFAENRSAEGADHRVNGLGMEFAGAPAVLIGQTDKVAYTSTTAQLPVVDTFFEQVTSENADVLHYDDEGTPAPLSKRTEIFRGGVLPDITHTYWRSHARSGNAGSRAVVDFLGDKEGTADSGSSTTLVDAGAFDASYVGGAVAIVDGVGAGQIRTVSAVPNTNTLTVGSAWTTTPTSTSVYVAVKPGHGIVAAAEDSAGWLEESTTVLGFLAYQRAENILDIRAGARLMPTTHNFPAADGLPFNGIGTASGLGGNIGYWSSGYSRIRQGGEDPRLPLDGGGANPLVVVSGAVTSATATTLVAGAGAFTGKTFTPPPFNYRYDHPTLKPTEFIVLITGGSGYKQTRRIASNDANSLTIESAWGVTPSPGDTFEVQEILAMPEAINPAEGYMSNWNNKAATTDPGDDFGRQFRHIFILERLAAENAWDRDKERQLNKEVAGLEGRGDIGRFLLPRLRQAVTAAGSTANIDAVLPALEANQAGPEFGRFFIDPISATTRAGEVTFVSSMVDTLADNLLSDEYSGAIPVPTGTRALNVLQHVLDSGAGDLPGAYKQAYGGNYFTSRDPLDPFTCYGVKTSHGAPHFKPQKGLTIADSLDGAATGNARKPTLLCAPASKDGATVDDTSSHLEAYSLGANVPVHTPQVITITDRFGSVSLTTVRPDFLLVPSGKALGGPAAAPSSSFGGFKCYKAGVTPNTTFTQTTTTFADGFQTRLYQVVKPLHLCTPANVNGTGLHNPTSHLVCYRIRSATPHTRVVGQLQTNDLFGTEHLDTTTHKEVCVPGLRVAEPTWQQVVRDKLDPIAGGGIPADSARPNSTYRHPLSALFPSLVFEPTPFGNRGTYEQILDVQPTRVNGEFMFPLGQSGLIQGTLAGVTSIDPNVTSLQPIWRDWRFVPILHVGQDLAGTPSGDSDGDGILDGYERWYFGDLSHNAADDSDGDGLTLLQEFLAGTDPTDPDTDDDGFLDGVDAKPQDRKVH